MGRNKKSSRAKVEAKRARRGKRVPRRQKQDAKHHGLTPGDHNVAKGDDGQSPQHPQMRSIKSYIGLSQIVGRSLPAEEIPPIFAKLGAGRTFKHLAAFAATLDNH